MQQPLHFVTGNAPLAHALHAVGFKLLAVWNKYTDATLDHLKLPSVEAAMRSGKPGALEYVFERRDDLQAALDAWDAAGKAFEEGRVIESKSQAAEDIIIARATMRSHEPFHNLWKSIPGIYIAANGAAQKTEGAEQTTVSHPGFRIQNTAISEPDRIRLFKP